MAMLATVSRPSMLRPRMVSPANSITCPDPPAKPIRPMTAMIRSLAVTPVGKAPSTVMRMLRARRATRVWVARMCSTSEVPIEMA